MHLSRIWLWLIPPSILSIVLYYSCLLIKSINIEVVNLRTLAIVNGEPRRKGFYLRDAFKIALLIVAKK